MGGEATYPSESPHGLIWKHSCPTRAKREFHSKFKPSGASEDLKLFPYMEDKFCTHRVALICNLNMTKSDTTAFPIVTNRFISLVLKNIPEHISSHNIYCTWSQHIGNGLPQHAYCLQFKPIKDVIVELRNAEKGWIETTRKGDDVIVPIRVQKLKPEDQQGLTVELSTASIVYILITVDLELYEAFPEGRKNIGVISIRAQLYCPKAKGKKDIIGYFNYTSTLRTKRSLEQSHETESKKNKVDEDIWTPPPLTFEDTFEGT